MSRRHWEKQASNWASWARTAEFDAYWKYAPAFFELVPPPTGRTIEVGCGEGRVTRDLLARGHDVVAVDATAELLQLAHEADQRATYLRCDAAALPFQANTFDLAVFYNYLMDIDDMQSSLREAARILRQGGRLCACVTHPIADAGRFESTGADAPFVVEGSYLGPRRWLQKAVERAARGVLHSPRASRVQGRSAPRADLPGSRKGPVTERSQVASDPDLSDVALGQGLTRGPLTFSSHTRAICAKLSTEAL